MSRHMPVKAQIYQHLPPKSKIHANLLLNAVIYTPNICAYIYEYKCIYTQDEHI